MFRIIHTEPKDFLKPKGDTRSFNVILGADLLRAIFQRLRRALRYHKSSRKTGSSRRIGYTVCESSLLALVRHGYLSCRSDRELTVSASGEVLLELEKPSSKMFKCGNDICAEGRRSEQRKSPHQESFSRVAGQVFSTETGASYVSDKECAVLGSYKECRFSGRF